MNTVGGPPTAFPLKFDTFTYASSVVIESEDYNTNSGGFTDNPPPNAYANGLGTPDVDFHDVSSLGVALDVEVPCSPGHFGRPTVALERARRSFSHIQKKLTTIDRPRLSSVAAATIEGAH